ncbi:hypothetical protein CORC01_00424 [Colletotrichum orchidophilum]|uniref:Uncharacterized protein n=1 Tax=Colletotrichum orchidophilum TaxID=1209926 RepID=A0A1G4BS00_9PEZI|nr:uncharacterized protein CORC01_00424 [Colletotrichum orchidophilum]OHF04085.1 hypothetical protein CORC01_00424 [Colletotrichum orchidophilum]
MISYKSLFLFVPPILQNVAANTCNNHGSWYIKINLAAGAQGNRRGDLYAEHSKTPGVISHSMWIYDPETQLTTYTPDDPTLNNTLISVLGLQNLDIQQTVLGIPLKGSGLIDMYFNPGANGRGGKGNTTIVSELDN